MQKTEQVEREAESKNYHHRKKLVFTLRVTEIVLLVTLKHFCTAATLLIVSIHQKHIFIHVIAWIIQGRSHDFSK